MFALSYDCGLRKEERCTLRLGDFDHGLRTITVRAECTKSRRAQARGGNVRLPEEVPLRPEEVQAATGDAGAIAIAEVE